MNTIETTASVKRQKPKPRRVVVGAVKQLTPRVTRVTFTGDGLSGFPPPPPGSHMKIFMPDPGHNWEPGAPGPRPPTRTYTPRRLNSTGDELDVDFVLHGDGLAANWVQSTVPGDEILIAGPGGGYQLPQGCKNLVILADETAIPAAGTVLESLPTNCSAQVICEVEDAREERPLSDTVQLSPEWLHRSEHNTIPCSLLVKRVLEMDVPDGSAWWIACEAAAMRKIRDHLKKERGIDPELLHHRGYWRYGEENYPDHDYGTD